MIFTVYGRAFKTLFRQPWRLLGLAMFTTLLTYLSYLLFVGIPAAGVIGYLLMFTAFGWICLKAVRGETSKTVSVFDVCKDRDTCKRVLIGMAWKDLWILIWALIPVVGIVFATMKIYEYRFVPYILLDEPEVKPVDALKRSSERTKGIRGKMFLSDLILAAVFFFAVFSLMSVWLILSRFMYAFSTVAIIYLSLVYLIVIVLALAFSLFTRLSHAGYYEEVLHPTPKPVRARPADPGTRIEGVREGYAFCQRCGAPYQVGEAVFCAKCGNRLVPEKAEPDTQEPAYEEEDMTIR